MKQISSKAIANYFLELARKDGKEVRRGEILNLVFLANLVHSRLKGEGILSEGTGGNRYGPLAELDAEFARFGDRPISGFAREWYAQNGRTGVSEPSLSRYPDTLHKRFVLSLLVRIWNLYRDKLGQGIMLKCASAPDELAKLEKHFSTSRRKVEDQKKIRVARKPNVRPN